MSTQATRHPSWSTIAQRWMNLMSMLLMALIALYVLIVLPVKFFFTPFDPITNPADRLSGAQFSNVCPYEWTDGGTVRKYDCSDHMVEAVDAAWRHHTTLMVADTIYLVLLLGLVVLVIRKMRRG